jgi:hypothetical protein
VAAGLARALPAWDVPLAPRAIERPRNAHVFGPDAPAWWVRAPWCDRQTGLRSSRVIVIAKADGRVLYDGSANDEG